VISPANQRIDPACRTIDARSRQDPGVQVHVSRESPGAESDPKIGVLAGMVKGAVNKQGRSGVGKQCGITAVEKHIPSLDVGADRQMDCIAEETEGPVTDFDRPEEWHRVEVAQQLKCADIRVDLGRSFYRRQDRAVDLGEPEIGREENLHATRKGRILRARRRCGRTKQRQRDDKARQCRPGATQGRCRPEAPEERSHCFSQAWKSPSLQGSESSWRCSFMQALIRPSPGGT